MEDLRAIIVKLFDEALSVTGSKLEEPLSDDTVLLKSGLDSLGFAILVARLEEDLGYDPFTRMEEPIYPRTFKDFVDIYEQYKPKD